MLRNYMLVALRLLNKNKRFALINILGLATGIACCILITLYIQDEFNFEKGIAGRERIFRINTTWVHDGVSETGPVTSPPVATDLARELPDIEAGTRVSDESAEQHIIRYNDLSFFETKAFLVDSNFLKVFPFPLIEGDPATALDGPASLLISQKLSKNIFGDKSPLDELLIIHSGPSADTFRVTGVVANPAFPSHLDANLYMSMNSNGTGQWLLGQTTWADNNVVNSYVKLHEPKSWKGVESKFADQLERHAGEVLRASGRKKILSLQPLDDIRLHSDMLRARDGESRSSITYIRIIATIGIFILLLACINFMNLTTAKSTQRASEVGIRKSMGAYKGNLVRQFLGESMVIVTIALLVAFLIVTLVLPTFNTVMQKQLEFTANNLPFILGASVLICIVTALVAGSYPAFFLSALKPTDVLKGKGVTGDGSQLLRKGLVVMQFVITITLISSIVIIQQQMKFMQSMPLGYATDHVIMIPLRTQQSAGQYSVLKAQYEQLAGVKNVSASTSIPSTPLSTDWGIYKEGATPDQLTFVHVVRVDKDYFKTLNIDLLTGRDFIIEADNLATDTAGTTKVIVNEETLRSFNIPVEKAVGSALFFKPGDEAFELTIVGVVKDFHQFSLHRKIVPMMFFLPSSRNYFRYLAASVDMSAYDKVQAEMKTLWDKQVNDAPFESIFLNENIKTLYQAEKRTSSILTISTTIALIISCLGLYGLSVYVAERKVKEIGVRKIVGASISSILMMLSASYVKLIAISFVISIPVGYYFMNKWLQGFAYHIDPGVGVFLLSGIISFVLAWVTISFESFRAARRNPAETLRNN
jgi:putative ABC transport system permease protein